MHKFLLRTFIKSKNFVQFLKVFDVFLIMMLLLHWVEHLLNSKWGWMGFIRPLLDVFVSLGAMINDSSVDFFGAVFEFKFFFAAILLLFLYFLIHLDYILVCFFENAYLAGREKVHRIQEVILNKSLERDQVSQQKKLQSYIVYISGALKNDSVTKMSNINLDEQINLMNKFLIEKTGINPEKFDNGFIYRFFRFDNIDASLEIFFKVLHSKAPLNYQICVVLEENDKTMQNERLRNIVNLGFWGKITMLSNVAYRYTFTENQKYATSQLGIFQKGNGTIEVHEFVEPSSEI